MSVRGLFAAGRSRMQGRLVSSVRRVALGATLVALVVYVIACAVADEVVVRHLDSPLDSRLSAQIAGVEASLGGRAPKGILAVPAGGLAERWSLGGSDIDHAPVLVWWLARGASFATGLESGLPHLARASASHPGLADVVIAGRRFRVDVETYAGGTLISGTSEQDSRDDFGTFLLAEVSFAPIVFVTLYGAAWLIGRAAVAPVERARLRQLEFTADASHELRTPLSVIEAEVSLTLAADRSGDDYREVLGRVSEESQRLRSIVDDLLWLARLDALPPIHHADEVDIATIARSCTKRFESLAAVRGQTISCSVTSGSACVSAAPDFIDRLIAVLVDNACRYAPDGGHVEVSVVEARGRVSVVVEDDGPGIAEDERSRIFARFHRASAAHAATTASGGAGLGLAIADAVVGATGGSWSIGSSKLGGARVEVVWERELPRTVHVGARMDQ